MKKYILSLRGFGQQRVTVTRDSVTEPRHRAVHDYQSVFMPQSARGMHCTAPTVSERPLLGSQRLATLSRFPPLVRLTESLKPTCVSCSRIR
jgi:hypothetical protein